MDLDLDLDSNMASDWIGFWIQNNSWIWTWIWIYICKWIRIQIRVGLNFLHGFGFGLGLYFQWIWIWTWIQYFKRIWTWIWILFLIDLYLDLVSIFQMKICFDSSWNVPTSQISYSCNYCIYHLKTKIILIPHTMSMYLRNH